MNGTLYIVATPIGNLEDITLRALRILREVDVVFCEDTRMTHKILERHNITAKLQSLNARTEGTVIPRVIEELHAGHNVAYVSDAGTPGISDPGVRLVSYARKEGIEVIGIPGPSALTTALSIAGVPTHLFTFMGFLPQKKGRQTALTYIAHTEHTVVCYESTHRITKLLKELIMHVPSRRVSLARELTKMHEEVLSGLPAELLTLLETDTQKQKGEFVVIISN